MNAATRIEIQAGDTVRNKRNGEIWFVLGVNRDTKKVCVAGYPPTIASLLECEMYKPGNGIDASERKYRDKTFGPLWDD